MSFARPALLTYLSMIVLASASASAQTVPPEELSGTVESETLGGEATDESEGAEVAEPGVYKSARWYIETALRARVNPLGLTLYADGGYRIPLYKEPNPLFDLAQIDLSVTTQISPAYIWGGPQIEIAPLSILVLRATVQGLYYFGTFGYVYEYGFDGDWGPDDQDAVEDAKLGETAGGYMAEVAATLQAMAFNVVARVSTVYTWYFVDVDDAYVEPFNNLLLAPDDAVWITTSILGYVLADQLLLGALWEHSDTRETDVFRDLVGLLVLWDIPPHLWAWGQPEVASVLAVYVRDPYLENQLMWGFELSLRF